MFARSVLIAARNWLVQSEYFSSLTGEAVGLGLTVLEPLAAVPLAELVELGVADGVRLEPDFVQAANTSDATSARMRMPSAGRRLLCTQ